MWERRNSFRVRQNGDVPGPPTRVCNPIILKRTRIREHNFTLVLPVGLILGVYSSFKSKSCPVYFLCLFLYNLLKIRLRGPANAAQVKNRF